MKFASILLCLAVTSWYVNGIRIRKFYARGCNKLSDDVTLCSVWYKKALLLPTFTIESLDGSLRFDDFFNTTVRTLKVRLLPPKDWEKVVENSTRFRKYYVELADVSYVKFVNLKYNSLKSVNGLSPCFHFVNDRKIPVVRNKIELELFEVKGNEECFRKIKSRLVEDVVGVTFKIKSVTVRRLFERSLVISNELSTTTSTTTTTTTSTTTTTTTTTKVPTTVSTDVTIQRRIDGSVSFARNWNEYEHKFGSAAGSFWIGLHKLRQLTKDNGYKLVVEMKKFGDNKLYYTTYNIFMVGPASDHYRLKVSGYDQSQSNFDAEKSNHGLSYNNGTQFTTYDAQHDGRNKGEGCAQTYGPKAGWWFPRNCGYVYGNSPWSDEKLNGDAKYIIWNSLDGWNSLRFFHMKLIRK